MQMGAKMTEGVVVGNLVNPEYLKLSLRIKVDAY